MRTPAQLSPQRLCQELVRDDPWKVLAVCIMLNQTSGTQVRQIFPGFFERWPTAEALAAADREEVIAVIRPLGLYNRRATSLMTMSAAWAAGMRPENGKMFGVGRYARDSYTIFCQNYLLSEAEVQDKELKRYAEWARQQVGEDDHHRAGRVQRGGEAGAWFAREAG